MEGLRLLTKFLWKTTGRAKLQMWCRIVESEPAHRTHFYVYSNYACHDILYADHYLLSTSVQPPIVLGIVTVRTRKPLIVLPFDS